MKKLILFRHAEAENAFSSNTDFDRRLTEKGMNDAVRVAKDMMHHEPRIDKVYHSSSVRTTMTAEVMAGVMKINQELLIPVEELYNASVGKMLEIVNKLDSDAEVVLLVGHNPSISYLAEYLDQSMEQAISFSPANGAGIAFELDTWEAVSQSLGTVKWMV